MKENFSRKIQKPNFILDDSKVGNFLVQEGCF